MLKLNHIVITGILFYQTSCYNKVFCATYPLACTFSFKLPTSDKVLRTSPEYQYIIYFNLYIYYT